MKKVMLFPLQRFFGIQPNVFWWARFLHLLSLSVIVRFRLNHGFTISTHKDIMGNDEYTI